MTTFRRISYSTDKQIDLSVNDSGNQFLWLGFAQNTSGVCKIKKVSSFSPDQVFFNLNRSIDGIVEATILGNFIYFAYEDNSLLGEKISLSNPLSTTTDISKPVGITENPVDILTDGTFIYYLIPGSESGTNAKILKYTTSPSLSETIDLTKSGSEVTNAVSFTYDDITGDIWVVIDNGTNQLVRVYQDSGGIWDFEIET